MISWYWWMVFGAVGTIVAILLFVWAFHQDYDRRAGWTLAAAAVLLLGSAVVGTVPVGFPESTGFDTTAEVCQ